MIFSSILLFLSLMMSSPDISFLSDSTSTAAALDTIVLKPNEEIKGILAGQILSTKKKHRSEYAIRAYDWFKDAPVMGKEEIAIWLAKEYFLNDRLKCDSNTLFEMRAFVLMNEQSLLGMQAPPFTMKDTSGVEKSLSDLIYRGEYTILFFYSTDCIKCRMATAKLVDFVNDYNKGVLNVMAVCTDSSKSKWTQYINSHFYVYNPFVNWENVYDPEAESAYHMLYGVIETPKIFLLDKDGIIKGRNLSVENIRELLENFNKEKEGMDEFFKGLFEQAADEEAVKSLIDLIYTRATVSENGGQGRLFNDIFHELYLYLKSSSNYDWQCGAAYIGEKYIVGMQDRWKNPNFVEKVRIAVELFNRNPLGSKAASLDLIVPGGIPLTLDDIYGDWKVLFFYNTSCGLCQEAGKLLAGMCAGFSNDAEKTHNVKFIAIYTGSNHQEWLGHVQDSPQSPFWHEVKTADENARDRMYESYDLSALPAIYLLDKQNRVVAKDLNPSTLEGLLKYILSKNDIQ